VLDLHDNVQEIIIVDNDLELWFNERKMTEFTTGHLYNKHQRRESYQNGK